MNHRVATAGRALARASFAGRQSLGSPLVVETGLMSARFARPLHAILLGTTFLSVCHTHAKANLICLEQWDTNHSSYGKAPMMTLFAPVKSAETKNQ